MLTTDGVQRTIGRRYVLQKLLGEGGMGSVYRAVDRLSDKIVALKQVQTGALMFDVTQSQNIMEFRLALAKEFKLLASIRHPNIIEVLDYGFDDQREPFYTMELIENAQTILEAAKGKPIQTKVELLVQMLQALAYLHRRGILHRDIKPANVLVHEGRVKVLDFGLSTMHDRTASANNEEVDMTVGTLGYMPPEVLVGSQVSETGDLYSVGILAYEMFAGQHPYDTPDIGQLVNNILYQIPDVYSLDISFDLAAMLYRLVAKEPRDRYQSAAETIAAIAECVEYPIALETAATRESFLQAAQLIGRESELEKLTKALTNTMDGQGSIWLIAGESGVGKSRLVDEMRTRALVEGIQVIGGQAVSEAGTPYQLWRVPIMWLSLLQELTPEDSAIIRSLVPDVMGPVEGDLPLSVNASQARKRLIQLFQEAIEKLDQPIVLILEDLHWAGSESLSLIRELENVVKNTRLLVIASFRDDERPDLPEQLPNTPILKLNRLSEAHIADLSEAMLGAAGRQHEVVTLLNRETEGNVFFIIEVIRTLAEEAGQLDQIGTMTLPEQVFAGGMWRIIQHRLSHIPEYAQDLLQVAAVAGRYLDLTVLTAIKHEDVDMDRWLLTCSNAAVLEVSGSEWRFAHDKLRDGVLQDISEEQRRAMHGKIAEAYEAVYGTEADRAVALAYHWRMAKNDRKEHRYAVMAGRQTLRSGAYNEALKYFTRALELTPEAEGETRVSLIVQIAEAHLGMGGYDRARGYYLEALELASKYDNPTARAVALHGLGDIAYLDADYVEAHDLYKRSYDLYHGLEDFAGAARALNSLGNVAYDMGDQKAAKEYYQQSLDLSRESGAQWGMAGTAHKIEGDELKLDTQEMERLIQELDNLLQKNDLRATTEIIIQLGDIVHKHKEYGQTRRYLQRALQAGHQALDAELTLTALMHLSRMFIAQERFEEAVELLAFMAYYGKSPENIQDEAERLMFDLESKLSATTMSALWDRGKQYDLDAAIHRTLEWIDVD